MDQVKPLKLPAKYKKKGVLPPFLHLLPGELRNKIYEMIDFRRSKRIALAECGEHYFARVAKPFPGLRAEINSFVFTDCMFEVEVHTRFVKYPSVTSSKPPKNPIQWQNAGKLVLPKHHWTLQKSAGVHFSKISFLVNETGGTPIARVHFTARARNEIGKGRPRASMVVRDINSVLVKKSVAIMVRNARKLVSEYSREADFAGFTMAQVDQLASCFTWKEADVNEDYQRLRKHSSDLEDSWRRQLQMPMLLSNGQSIVKM